MRPLRRHCGNASSTDDEVYGSTPDGKRRRATAPATVPAGLTLGALADVLFEIGSSGGVEQVRIQRGGICERTPVRENGWQLWSLPGTTTIRSQTTRLGPRGVYRSYWSGTGIGINRLEGLTIRCRAAAIGKGVHALELRPSLRGWVLPDDETEPERAHAVAAPRWYLTGAGSGDIPPAIVEAAMRAVAADAATLCDETGLHWSALVTAIDSDGPLVLTEPSSMVTHHESLRHWHIADNDV
jgi:hypothetical protein